MPLALDELLGKRQFKHDIRRPPDDLWRARFRTDWAHSAARPTERRDFSRLTWQNLGYQLGQLQRAVPVAEIDAIYEILAERYLATSISPVERGSTPRGLLDGLVAASTLKCRSVVPAEPAVGRHPAPRDDWTASELSKQTGTKVSCGSKPSSFASGSSRHESNSSRSNRASIAA
jgi:hypothetical protein